MMRSNRRVQSMIFILSMAMFLLSGCSNDDLVMEPNDSAQKETVYMITKSTTSAFWKSVESGARAACTAYNMELIFEGPANEEDYEIQNEMIREAVEAKAKVIVVSAIDYNASVEAVEEAIKAGVSVIVIDSDINTENVVSRIGTDNYKAGQMAGEALLDIEERALQVGIVNFDKNSQNGQERERGFLDTIQESSRASIVETINVISTTEEAKSGTISMLRENPHINAIVTFNEWTSLGVGYAISELGLKDKVQVVAFDSNIVSVEMLETGEVDALIVQNPYAMGYLGVESAYNQINGFGVSEDRIDTATTCVTKENMYDEECQKALFAFEQTY